MRMEDLANEAALFLEEQDTYTAIWDPIEDLKAVQVGPLTYQVKKISTFIYE